MKELQVNLLNATYNIKIEKNLLKSLGKEVVKLYKGEKIVVITDENVNNFYGAAVESSLKAEGYDTLKVVLKPGEKTKSFSSLMELYNKLIDFKINRGSLLIALGGGVIGDLAGFCAATFLRGIPYVQVPTSLLAQVDSSVGGKVAIDLPQGKNLVGSFYQPKAVFIDPEVLKSLPQKYINDGMGEIIKYSLIKDKELYHILKGIDSTESLISFMEDIIYTCCFIKKTIVEADEKDLGERMVLNFGHTIGHSIEAIQSYEGFSHGEAVAVGMYEVTLRSEKMNLTKAGTAKKIKDLLLKFQLPYCMDSTYDLTHMLSMDKKNVGSTINMILLKDIGEVFIKTMTQNELQKFLKEEGSHE